MLKKRWLILCGIFLLWGCKNSNKKQTETYTIQNRTESKTVSRKPSAGKKLYKNFCMRCHMPNGKGVPKIYPPLAGSDWLVEKREASIRAVKYGLNGKITVNGKTYNNVMLPMGLSDKEIAEVMNYIMTSWGNTQKKPVTQSEVSSIKE